MVTVTVFSTEVHLGTVTGNVPSALNKHFILKGLTTSLLTYQLNIMVLIAMAQYK